MTLYEKLIAAGLPIQSATEDGAITGLPGVAMTPAQIQTMNDIILEYFNPAEYADLIAWRTNAQELKAVYQDMIARLEQIQAASNPTNAQVIQAVKDEALYIERIMKVIKRMAT